MIYLLHAPITPRAFAEWAAGRVPGRTGTFDEGLALHVLLSALFGKGALQPFRLFTPARGNWSLYAYTVPALEELTALVRAVAPPEMLAVLPLDGLRAKPMPAGFAVGARLGFDLRARPVRRGQHERDAYQSEAETSYPEGKTSENLMAASGRSREVVYREWLADRLGGIATLETCRLTSFRRHRAWRDGRPHEGPDAILQGTLTVQDSAGFQRLLARGVGRHCAYGYGMLLLRPPDRPAPAR